MVDKPPIDPKDVAASTAVGSAQRYGVGAFRRRQAEGAGAGTGGRKPRRRGTLSYILTALVFAGLLVAMLVAMVKIG